MAVTNLTSNFKSELLSEISRQSEINKMVPRGGFVRDGFLAQLFTRERLKERLSEFQPCRSAAEMPRLVDFIKNDAKIVYATLVLIDGESQLPKIVKGQVDDKMLFGASDSSRTYCTKEVLRAKPELREVAEEFYEWQFVFPPTLSPDAETLCFPADLFRFPFETKPSYINSGSFGQVHGVVIDEYYLKYPQPGESDNKLLLVYKKIRRETEDVSIWKRLLREVKTLRRREHRNVTPLLADFIAGLEHPENPKDRTECLYLIFPRAAMDMDRWMYNQPDYTKVFQDDELRQHIWEAMRGLMSAVTYIHREIGGEVGYHGDLKPKNILIFGPSPKWIWQICDFGSSNLKPVAETGTRNLRSTPLWAPREWLENTPSRDRRDHGRAHDVFSLGLVFLILARVMVYKWDPDALKKWKEVRAKVMPETENLFPADRDAVVKEYIQQINVKDQRRSLRQAIGLIEEMLKDLPERPFSWEIEVDLFDSTVSDITEDEILTRLKDVIQDARDIDSQLTHRPLKRAKRRGRKGRFIEILKEAGWFDEQTSDATKKSRMAGHYVSTFSPLQEEDPPVIEKEDIFQNITKILKERRSVALSGLCGTGKTLVVRQYVSKLPVHEHRFWVNAKDYKTCFQDSYRKIVNKWDPHNVAFSNEDTFCEDVKTALETTNQPWLMIVDGLDIAEEAHKIERFLPRPPPGVGKIIITTRNSSLVRDLVDLRRKDCIVPLSPTEEIGRQILEYYLGDHNDLMGTKQQTDELLRQLPNPDALKRIAMYMIEQQNTCKDMCSRLKGPRIEIARLLWPDWPISGLQNLLQPALAAPLRIQDMWTHEVQLLFLLSIFNNKYGVNFKLLKVEYGADIAQSKLRTWLGTLKNCYLITKDPSDDVYFVNPIVRLAVLAWVEENERKLGFLKRYNKALSMMFRSYDHKRRTDIDKKKHDSGRVLKSRYFYKSLFMPHFAEFVEFTRLCTNSGPFDFTFYDRAIQAIVIFSDVLLDKDCYRDAIRVLKFAQQHFLLTILFSAQSEQRPPRLSVYFELNQKLSKSYIPRPFETAESSAFKDAKTLAEQLVQEARDIGAKTKNVSWEGKTLREWEVLLDLVQIYGKCRDTERALAWERIEEARKIMVVIDNDKNVPSAPQIPYDSADASQRRKLAIRVKREIGLHHMNIDQGQEDKMNAKEARRWWEEAEVAFRDANYAIRHWFRDDARQIAEIELLHAEALAKIGLKEGLDQAIRVFDRELERVRIERQTPGGDFAGDKLKRVLDLKFKLSAAQVKRGSPHIQKAEAVLVQLLNDYNGIFGIRRKRILDCAILLSEVYVKLGKKEEAEGLATQYPDMPPLKKALQTWFGR